MLKIAEELLFSFENIIDKSLQNAFLSIEFIKKDLLQIKIKSLETTENIVTKLDLFIHQKLDDFISSKFKNSHLPITIPFNFHKITYILI